MTACSTGAIARPWTATYGVAVRTKRREARQAWATTTAAEEGPSRSDYARSRTVAKFLVGVAVVASPTHS
ncbi:MAG: hypothetical protein ACTHM1_01910 [Solirubrobacteraceae bacterium]